jgi:hypothetical protein
MSMAVSAAVLMQTSVRWDPSRQYSCSPFPSNEPHQTATTCRTPRFLPVLSGYDRPVATVPARHVRGVWHTAFYGPADWVVAKTSVAQRRAVNFWLLVLWIFPGALIWWGVRSALWFVGFMSLYAIWVSHWTNFSAETPVEEESNAA